MGVPTGRGTLGSSRRR
ncbi:hypothetical protein E2C01_080865 [Portunus trituberculatus]|uniref:Uncharacterized protein n=1 Tax=Portunus trituberculatus TaxID=210409 RepID=A0A5B7IUI6_PORTR|nr:hypothetical protein [Portunus trituberculatus]